MSVWQLLTEPSAALRSPHHRRQSRLMAAVLVVVVPAYMVMALAAAFTRGIAVSATDWLLGSMVFALAVLAYLLNRTEKYLRGAWVLSITAIVGPAIVGLREPDATRAIYSVLIALTGPLYASFLLPPRATVGLSLSGLVAMLTVIVLNPAIAPHTAIIPLFFGGYVMALTVVGAVLRDRQIAELEGGSALLRSTLDASQDAAIIIDRQGKVREWSHVAARMLGINQLDAVGKTLATLIQSDQPLEVATAPRKIELTLSRGDGTTFPCEGLVATLPDGRSAVFLRDVSERKQMEARLMMSDRLETMGRMVAGVAHEINNPLAYVTSNLNYLAASNADSQLDPAELKTVLDETLEGSRRIHTIVQDLRIFSRSGEFERVTPIQIESVLDSVTTIALHRLRESKATIVREYTGVGSAYAVESRLAQVFLNLIVNAAQALGDTDDRRIVLSTRRDDEKIIISVRDFGPGIPEEVRARLFSPFFTTKPAGQGTGLGLYISQNIISALKGELRLGRPEKGALFEVILPAVD